LRSIRLYTKLLALLVIIVFSGLLTKGVYAHSVSLSINPSAAQGHVSIRIQEAAFTSFPSIVDLAPGNYLLRADNDAYGYAFSSWTVSGAVSVASTTQTLTTLFVSGPGTLTANYQAPTLPFDISMSASRGIIVAVGGSGSNTITATLTQGRPGAVSLACIAASLPAGASCLFGQSSGTPNPTFSSSLTISTSTWTSTGSYTVVVRGSGTEAFPGCRYTTFVLTVNPSS